MMDRRKLFELIKERKSYLCVGLDTDLEKIPSHLKEVADPVFEFNKQIIDATRDYCVAYKPNLAFYEANGQRGWESLRKTFEYIGDLHFTIADAKRGDIGNTSKLYAHAIFEELNSHSITVAPYMGHDSVQPFLQFEGRWVIVLALTSNPGSADFQLQQLEDGRYLFELVIDKCREWASAEQLMFVVGATQSEWIAKVRKAAPDNFFLVPGVGAQGGDLKAISEAGLTEQVGLLINASRSIIYASDGVGFAEAAAKEANKLQKEMEAILKGKGII